MKTILKNVATIIVALTMIVADMLLKAFALAVISLPILYTYIVLFVWDFHWGNIVVLATSVFMAVVALATLAEYLVSVKPCRVWVIKKLRKATKSVWVR